MNCRRIVAMLALGAVVLRAGPTPPIPAADGPGNEPAHIVGISSCAARSCHGGDEPLPAPIVRSEYTTWEFLDPHTRSLEVLSNDASKKIMAKFTGGTVKASEDRRCLACHAVETHANGRVRWESVGCESCHGKASNWLDPHTLGRARKWREKYAHAAGDFVDVDELPKLAETCAGCHIGSPKSEFPGVPRDMNHDMIAAGHPPLHFEFAGYLAQLPEHWNEKKHAGDPAYFAKAWTAGQVASAKAALELLEYRTQQSHTWPELAEYACYMCHHNIRGSGDWRQKRTESPGTPAWGAWHFAALPAIISDAEERRKIEDFRKLMAARPDGTTARKAAASLKPILERIIREPIKPADLAAVQAALQKAAPNDWAGAAQLYLALAALGTDADRQALRRACDELRHPAEFNNEVGERLQSAGRK